MALRRDPLYARSQYIRAHAKCQRSENLIFSTFCVHLFVEHIHSIENGRSMGPTQMHDMWEMLLKVPLAALND